MWEARVYYILFSINLKQVISRRVEQCEIKQRISIKTISDFDDFRP